MPFRVDQSPKRATKVPPMYSPRTDGGGILASRVIPPSPLSKGLDGSTGSFSLPSVDYDDVFGGPPRLATSVLAAEDNPGSSAALDRSVARAPSFRSPALPVFELPVFGDAAYSSSNTFEARPASIVYDDIFREEIHVPDVYTAAGIYGNIPRSKASSRSASRRMSPIHPAASLPDQLLHEEILAAASTGAFSKGRSSVGKMEGRNSFSSPSFDEGRSKPLDPVFMAVRNDTVGSSLPASPPHSGTWGHLKRFTTSKSVHNLGAAPTSGEVDDVFGGFPRRTYPPVFQGADLGTSELSKMPNVFIRGIAEKKATSSPLKTKSSEPYAGLNRTLSSSSSSDGERELQDDFIEICMDKQSGGAPEKTEAAANRAWVTVSDLRQSAHPTPKKAFPRPPPVPAPASPSSGSLKHKSWKDWSSGISERPPVSSSSGLEDTSLAFETGSKSKKELINCTSTSQQDKGTVEARSLKQLQNNSAVQPPRGKFTVFSPLRTALKAKPLVETLQLEERELHSMLNNAWKSNEKREKKKSQAERPAEDVSAGLIMQDSGLKEGKKQPSSVPNSFQNHQGSQITEDKKAGLHWKSWRKHSNKEKMGSKESAKLEFAHESKQMKASGHNVQDIIDERAENGVNSNRLSEYEDSFDPEEIVKEVTEETSANCPKKDLDRSGNIGVDIKSHKKEAEDVKIAGDGKSVACIKDEGEVTSGLSSRNGSVQDFGQFNEQQEVSLSDGVEEADLLAGLDSSLIGFQDIEGESVERRKARWMRHLHAKQRAAKALEEMQQRDAEVLRQQAEKQQLAENADRQIKRWATGKEGNLRALLSNLQHVLWSDSGWKPISLTDLIEGPDVKKAYRKATLFVHPDKLQQKGATLQQKYIAERVFDILQEAWKTFNLQELF